MLLDRLGRRIEAGCVVARTDSGSLRVVTSVERELSMFGDWLFVVKALILEPGVTIWAPGTRTTVRYRRNSLDLIYYEVTGNLYASACEHGEHDYDDAIDWLHPRSTSVCLRCGYVRNNAPPLL